MSIKEPQKTYHLYHHQPDPLAPDAVHELAWLLNNGVSYSVVATILAHTSEEALQALREKRAGHGKLARYVTLQSGTLLRETLPGDVLVGEGIAWMINAEGQLQRISYTMSHPWKSYTHTGPVACISWAPGGEHVVAISKTVALHSLARDDERYDPTYHRHESTGYAVAWSPDGHHIASGGYDGEVHVWTPDPSGNYRGAAIGSLLICRTQERGEQQKITSIAWAPDSQHVLAGRSIGDIVQWNAVTGACLQLCKRHYDDINVLAYSPDTIHIASASDDGTLRIWELEQMPSYDLVCQHAGPVSACAWSPDGTLLVSACEDDPSLHFWDVLSGEPGERIALSASSTSLPCILALAWSPDGRYIAAGCDDATLQIVDVDRRRHVFTYWTGHNQKRVCAVAWSPDGTSIASGGTNPWNSGGQVCIWQYGMSQ